MKKILIALIATHLSALVTQGQSELAQNLPLPRIDQLGPSLMPTETHQQVPSRILPDSPIPVLPSLQDGPAPCPSGDGKSCALLGGRLYFSDPIHMTQHDATWREAAMNPAMLVADALNLAATVADIEGTEACLRANTCTEANPLLGSHPSRARAYGTAIPVAFVNYAAAAWLKKSGKGNLAFGLLWGTTMLHTYLAAGAFAQANRGAPTNSNSVNRQKIAIAIRF